MPWLIKPRLSRVPAIFCIPFAFPLSFSPYLQHSPHYKINSNITWCSAPPPLFPSRRLLTAPGRTFHTTNSDNTRQPAGLTYPDVATLQSQRFAQEK
jgi:hypothetical protein